jgi:hypothetical protein
MCHNVITNTAKTIGTKWGRSGTVGSVYVGHLNPSKITGDADDFLYFLLPFLFHCWYHCRCGALFQY